MQAGVPSSLLSPQSTELWSRRETKDLPDYEEKEEKGARSGCLLPKHQHARPCHPKIQVCT